MDAIEELIGPSGQADPFHKWRLALAEPNKRDRVAVSPEHPETGYYRHKNRGLWEPVAYWYSGSQLHCMYGIPQDDEDPCWWPGAKTEERHIELAIEHWTYAWQNPISEEVYDLVMCGSRWPDLDETVEEQVSRPRGAGDNAPPQDELTELKIDIENAAAAVERYKDINDDETSKKAQSARARLNELARKADKRREELVAPALAKQREVNGLYQPLVKDAKAAADAIGRAMGTWETKKARAQREAEQAEQRAADRAIAAGTPPAAMDAPSAAPTPAPATQIRGGYGRAAAVVEEAVIEEVTDYRALLAHYGEREDVKALVMKHARTDVRNGHQVPGVKIGHERRVK